MSRHVKMKRLFPAWGWDDEPRLASKGVMITLTFLALFIVVGTGLVVGLWLSASCGVLPPSLRMGY